VPGLAKLETIQVGNHTVSMNIPDFPQYYISSTVLDNQEAIKIQFNQSLLRTLFLGPTHIDITIYNNQFGREETNTELKNVIMEFGETNFPGNYTVYTKKMLGVTGVVIEHPYSDFYHNIMVLDASAYIDKDSSGMAHALVGVISDYDRIVTGAIT
jgi:hypothetical protein